MTSAIVALIILVLTRGWVCFCNEWRWIWLGWRNGSSSWAWDCQIPKCSTQHLWWLLAYFPDATLCLLFLLLALSGTTISLPNVNTDLWGALEHFGSSCEPNTLANMSAAPCPSTSAWDWYHFFSAKSLVRGFSLKEWAMGCTLLASRDTTHHTEWQLVPVTHVLVAFVLEERSDQCQLASQLPW